MKFLLFILVILLVALQFRLWTGPGSFAEISRLKNQIEQQAAENASLSERNDKLYREVNDLKSGLDAVEEMARNDLGMIKKGEIFYLIVEEE